MIPFDFSKKTSVLWLHDSKIDTVLFEFNHTVALYPSKLFIHESKADCTRNEMLSCSTVED